MDSDGLDDERAEHERSDDEEEGENRTPFNFHRFLPDADAIRAGLEGAIAARPDAISVTTRHRWDGSTIVVSLHLASRDDVESVPRELLGGGAERARLERWLEERDAGWVCISACVNDKRAGVVLCEMAPVTEKGRMATSPRELADVACMVRAIYTVPEYRSMGVADKIWSYLVCDLQRAGMWGIVAVNALGHEHARFFEDHMLRRSKRWPGDLIFEFARPTRRCNECGAVAPHKCAGCGVVHYCSSQCQRLDWGGGHKSACKGLKRAAQRA